MKKLFAFISLALMSLSLSGCGTSMGVYADADKYLVGEQNYIEEVNTIDIDWISGKIILVEDETVDGVIIKEETDLTSEKELVHSYLNDGTLKIKFFASGHRRATYTPFKKELTVTYKPGLSKLIVDITSGSLKATSLTVNDFDLDMTSGNTKIDNLVANTVNADLTSGRLEITAMSVDKFDADITSGTVVTGFISLNKATYDMTSGRIDMTLPESGGVVKVSKTSGRVNTNRECSVSNNTYAFGTGSADIKVSMTSGTLNIA